VAARVSPCVKVKRGRCPSETKRASYSSNPNQRRDAQLLTCAALLNFLRICARGQLTKLQPEDVRNFLLQTAILNQFHGSLCDAVTGQREGSARLEVLERGNFFVVPLDEKRRWYRYHHLFADVLTARLMAEQPEQISTLHQRASLWHEQHGAVTDAIHHALAAKDFERVAELAELSISTLGRSREGPILFGWLKALPDEVGGVRPYSHPVFDGAGPAGTAWPDGSWLDVDCWLGCQDCG
jgi:hypothetical protein